MADDGSTTRQATTEDESGVHRLRDIVVEEVSLADRAANKRRFLLVKRSGKMADDGKPKRGANSQSEADAKPGAGGKKPRPKPDDNVDKARPRVMRAASEDDEEEDDGEEDDATEKARRPAKANDERDDDE